MSQPQFKPVEPESDDQRCKASVLPDRMFVQMPEMAQIKFKLSVAGPLHSGGERSQSGTG
jgi:hypothetical protein